MSMDHFNEEHSKLLLQKEWLVKVDPQTSTPYLFKFHCSAVDLTCCIMATDTKGVWAEVLSSNHLARRWRENNEQKILSPLPDDEEEAWRTRNLELLSQAHTLCGVQHLSFEIVDSNFGDLVFEIEGDAFKWRWNTIFVGYKISAEILSKHLIMPLISVSHLVFTSPNAVSNLPGDDLDKAIDKVGRTARRTVDTHIKNALSRPRLATTLRRMTAVFNFISDLPKVMTSNEEASLQVRKFSPEAKGSRQSRQSSKSRTSSDDVTPIPGNSNLEAMASQRPSPSAAKLDLNPATESEYRGTLTVPTKSAMKKASKTPSPAPRQTESGSPGKVSSSTDTDSSPLRPAKKVKRSPSSGSEVSEEERKKLAAQIRSGVAPQQTRRQPIKKGGMKF